MLAMTDQEHAKAIQDARKALNDAAIVARRAGLTVEVSTIFNSDFYSGDEICIFDLKVSRKITGE
jgi:hypothetical protein